jgi:hypothetical protein
LGDSREEQQKRKEIIKHKRGGCRREKKTTGKAECAVETDAMGKRKMDDREMSEEEGGNESDSEPASLKKKLKRNTTDEPAKGSVGPGKGMKLMFRPNLVVRGKATIPAGTDGRPRCYWQKVGKTPLQKVAAKLGLKCEPIMREYLKYIEKDILKVPSWTLPLCRDE